MLKNKLLTLLYWFAFLPAFVASDAFKAANSLYQQQNYDSAVTVYSNLIKDGLFSAEIHFNLGNCYYKTNNIPLAILHFEKALKYNPGKEKYLHNLELANAKITDKSPVKTEVALSKFLINIFSDSPNFWSCSTLLLLSLTLLGFGLYFFGHKMAIRKTGLYSGLLFGFAALMSLSMSFLQNKQLNAENFAIITGPSVQLKTEPISTAGTSFILHEGSKVEILNSNGNWREIKFGDGKIGWIELNDIAII